MVGLAPALSLCHCWRLFGCAFMSLDPEHRHIYVDPSAGAWARSFQNNSDAVICIQEFLYVPGNANKLRAVHMKAVLRHSSALKYLLLRTHFSQYCRHRNGLDRFAMQHSVVSAQQTRKKQPHSTCGPYLLGFGKCVTYLWPADVDFALLVTIQLYRVSLPSQVME